jgi:hypothetical protein
MPFVWLTLKKANAVKKKSVHADAERISNGTAAGWKPAAGWNLSWRCFNMGEAGQVESLWGVVYAES